ncbi:MAG: hypothetical protein ACTSRW_07950 [Candidatus Helarchaeota archaeon]
MELFEAFPDGELQFVIQACLLKDIINEENLDKVFLILNHAGREAWIWIGPKAQVQKKFACARAARRIISDRRLSYRIRTADGYGDEPKEFKSLLDCSLRTAMRKEGPPLEILKLQRYLLRTPVPEGMRREACIIGNKMYVTVTKQAMGQVSTVYGENDFIPDGVVDLPENYRIRIFSSHGTIQAVEFLVPIKKEKNRSTNQKESASSKKDKNTKKDN